MVNFYRLYLKRFFRHLSKSVFSHNRSLEKLAIHLYIRRSSFDAYNKSFNDLLAESILTDDFSAWPDFFPPEITPRIEQCVSWMYDKKMYSQAAFLASKARNPSPFISGTQGVCFYKLGKLQESVDSLHTAINYDPASAHKLWYSFLIKALLRLGASNQSTAIFQVARDHNKLNTNACQAFLDYYSMQAMNSSFNVEVSEYCIERLASESPDQIKRTYGRLYRKVIQAREISASADTEVKAGYCSNVEIAIPTFNRADIICSNILSTRKAESSLNMPSPITIRVLDNCSTDDTVLKISRFSADKNIFFSSNASNIGYTGSIIKLIHSCRSEFIIFTSDEDPVIVDELPRLCKFLNACDPDFCSPLFLDKNLIYRGVPSSILIPPEDYHRSSFYSSGLVFKRSFILNNLNWIEMHLRKPGQVYPQVLLAMAAIALGKSYWYSRPICYRLHKENLHHFETPTGRSFNNVEERWRQFQYSCSFLDDILQNQKTKDLQVNSTLIERMRTALMLNGPQSILNSMRRKYPELGSFSRK